MSSLTLWIIVVSGAGAAVVFGLLALVLARPRSRSEAAEHEPQQPINLAAPTDEPELERLRNVASFAAEIELDELCAHVLRVAVAAAAADAGAITILGSEPDASIVDSSGLTTFETDWLATSLQAHNNSSIITRYLYDEPTGLDERIGTLVLVPLRDSEGEPIGNLAALWRFDLVEEAEVRLHALEVVAADASTAITNAIRFHEVSALSIRDTATGLLNRRYFAGRLDAEVDRAQQSSASLTLLHVGLEESPDVDSQLKDVAELVRFELGARGEICRVGSAELAALVRASLVELQSALEQIRRRFAERGDGAVINAFELDDGEDSASFFGRAMSSTAQNGRLPIGTVKI